MDFKLDKSLLRTFEWMTQEMAYITHSRFAAEWIFWHNVHTLLCQSSMTYKSDAFGGLKLMFMDHDLRYHDFYFSGSADNEYAQMIRDFRFSDSLKDMGDFWKCLFKQGDADQIARTAHWLQAFQKEVMPAVDRCIAQIELEYQSFDAALTPESMDARKKAFRAHRAMLKRCQEKLEIYCEIRELM